MIKWYYACLAWLTGKNPKGAPVELISEQMGEMRPLPIGRKEFDLWSDRIISGCIIEDLSPESIKFALADQILHLGPTEDHKPDIFFIKSIRKFAVNQTADEMRKEIRDAAKARLTASEEAAKKLMADVLPIDAKTGK